MIYIPDGHIIVPQKVDDIDTVVTSTIQVIRGDAKAVTASELFLPYYGGLQKVFDSGDLKKKVAPKDRGDRNFDHAVKQRIVWAIDQGHINKGEFDDQKLRFDGCSFEKGILGPRITLRFGPSHFLEHLATNHKGMLDSAFYGRLTAKGQKDFGDDRAYFADNLAVNVVLKASDGKYVIGLRSQKQRFWPGRWHNIGGFYVPRFELFDRDDQGKSLLESFADRMLTEMTQEAAIKKSDISNLRLIGVSFGQSSFDLNYDAQVSTDSDYIRSKGHFKAKDADEHTGFYGVTFGELVDVLAGKKLLDLNGGVVDRPSKEEPSKFVPIGLGGLLIHVGLQDKDALNHILDQPQYNFVA